MAERLVNPLTRVASLLNFCPKASDKLWAGSVEIKSTLGRTLASWIAREQEVVVFPMDAPEKRRLSEEGREKQTDRTTGTSRREKGVWLCVGLPLPLYTFAKLPRTLERVR